MQLETIGLLSTPCSGGARTHPPLATFRLLSRMPAEHVSFNQGRYSGGTGFRRLLNSGKPRCSLQPRATTLSPFRTPSVVHAATVCTKVFLTAPTQLASNLTPARRDSALTRFPPPHSTFPTCARRPDEFRFRFSSYNRRSSSFHLQLVATDHQQ